MNEQLSAIADELAIDFYNPLSELESEALTQRFYFERDSHWNSNGNRRVGELLAEHIDATYLKEPAQHAGADPGSRR